MAHLDDTCVLHRGGPAGLRAVQAARGRVLAAGGMRTPRGAAADFAALDRHVPAPAGCRPAAAETCCRPHCFSTPCDERTCTAMQTLNYRFPATGSRAQRGAHRRRRLRRSGDPAATARRRATRRHAAVRVRTSVNGFDTVWHDVLERFFTRTPLAGRWELNDFGATPGVVTLRLRQAAEAATREPTSGHDVAPNCWPARPGSSCSRGAASSNSTRSAGPTRCWTPARAGAVRSVRPAGIALAGAAGHHPASRRRHGHRPRHRRRPPGGDRRHRAGLPGRRHRRGVGRQDLPGAAAGGRGLRGRAPRPPR